MLFLFQKKGKDLIYSLHKSDNPMLPIGVYSFNNIIEIENNKTNVSKLI